MSRLSKLSLALFLLCAVSAAACPLLPEQLQTAAGAMFVAFLACGGCLLSLEKSGASPRRLALIAAFTALSVCSRVVFAVTPGFKPVSALVILCGLHFGAGAGMATGALTALLSNLYFGQGPWTPFQMAGWGAHRSAGGAACAAAAKKQVVGQPVRRSGRGSVQPGGGCLECAVCRRWFFPCALWHGGAFVAAFHGVVCGI